MAQLKDITLPLRADLAAAQPYGAPQLDVPHLLNVNENPYSPPEAVISDIAESVRAIAAGLNRYPDREFVDLRRDLASYLGKEAGTRGLRAENIWAANGSNEVMIHLLQAFGGPGAVAMSFAPTYSMYPEYARDTFTTWVAGTRRDDFTIDIASASEQIRQNNPSLVLLASPNNPTGTALSIEEIRALAEVSAHSGPGGAATILVIDEAYAEFRREGTASAATLLEQYPNLVVTRTMSKAFAFAGVRLGYLAASEAIVNALRIVRLPYHLSAVTQAVARAALRHQDELQAQVAQLRVRRDETVAWLREHHWHVAETDSNFILFGLFEDRHAIWQGLLDRGVLIRETGPSGYLRVCMGTEEDMAAFRGALVEVTGQ